MINYFFLFYYLCLNFLLLSAPVRSKPMDNNQGKIRHFTESELINQNSGNTNISSSNIEPNSFITGLWRGFHESEGLTIYYGYQFRPDGSFLARHRIYQENTTLEDTTWQGEWQFKQNILIMKGFNLKDEKRNINLELKLTDTFKLAYQTSSLDYHYQGIILNKVGFL